MQRVFKITSDGSHTLYVPELNEHYHSIHGAVQESKHVFIEAGLKAVGSPEPKVIRILEIGFGTGLNALLTCLEAEKLGYQVNYTALEAYPLQKDEYEKLNFANIIEGEEVNEILQLIHIAPWEIKTEITSQFSLMKLNTKLEDAVFEGYKFNLVYFDAFAPEVQPELWTEEIFRKIYNSMANNGILVTYCCKGDVKRAMKAAGFAIEKLPGPPGKREMLRAGKNC